MPVSSDSHQTPQHISGESPVGRDPCSKLSIVQYWHSAELPVDVQEITISFGDLNPEAQHTIFNRSSAESFIAAYFSTREVEAFRACVPGAMQADYFRYCATYVLGGIYADADLKCVANLAPLLDDGVGALFGRTELDRMWTKALGYSYQVGDYYVIGNGFFAVNAPRKRLLQTAIDIATTNIEKRIADGPEGIWLTAGPGVFTSLYLLNELGSIDAFLRFTRGTALAVLAPIVCDIVANADDVTSMFAGMVLRPHSARRAWVEPVRVRRSGHSVERYWQAWQGTIYSE
jgi:hypothetical protein